MTWNVELHNTRNEAYSFLGSTIVASRATRDEARETGKWFVENDATVTGFRVWKNDPQTGDK